MIHDRASALSYRHYEDPVAKEMAQQHPQVLVDYAIVSLSKLSENLWEVILLSKTVEFPDGVYGANYIGVIDGKYYVMVNIKQIPEDLTVGVEIDPFEPSGPSIIDPGDIVGPIN